MARDASAGRPRYPWRGARDVRARRERARRDRDRYVQSQGRERRELRSLYCVRTGCGVARGSRARAARARAVIGAALAPSGCVPIGALRLSECVGVGARIGAFMLTDVTFPLSRGQWGVVFGPAGAGKTTLLEIIAGVRRHSKGRIALPGAAVTTRRPEARRLGVVYQHCF